MNILYDTDDFIFGDPIETRHGKVRFLKYREFSKFKFQLHFINQNVLHLYYMYLEMAKTPEEKKQLEEIKNMSLFDIVRSSQDLISSYVLVLQAVLDINGYSDPFVEDIITEILTNEDQFYEYRKLIQDMNLLFEEKVSPNEEIQKFFNKAKALKNKKGEKGNGVTSIATALAIQNGWTFDYIGDMTILQVHASYQKLSHFKNFEITSLFATVSKTDIEYWHQPIDLAEKETGIKESEFSSKFGGMMNA